MPNTKLPSFILALLLLVLFVRPALPQQATERVASGKLRLKLASIFILIIAFSCGGNNAPNSKSFKLPSGKEIKVSGVGRMDFPNGGSALVMNYETDIPIDDKVALRKEVDEIWDMFQKQVEAAQLKAGVIRATHVEGSGFVKSGKGYGFVFEKRDDGWHCLEDDKK